MANSHEVVNGINFDDIDKNPPSGVTYDFDGTSTDMPDENGRFIDRILAEELQRRVGSVNKVQAIIFGKKQLMRLLNQVDCHGAKFYFSKGIVIGDTGIPKISDDHLSITIVGVDSTNNDLGGGFDQQKNVGNNTYFVEKGGLWP